MTLDTKTPVPALAPSAAPAAPARRRPRAGRATLLATGIPLALLVLVAIAQPLLPLPDPHTQDLSAALRPPAWLAGGTTEHLLGTDQLGRDLLARMVVGARFTLMIAVLGVAAAAIPGILMGLAAGYLRGWVDLIISRLIDAQLALPFVLVAIALISARGRSLEVLVLVLCLAGWAQFARVVRAEVLSLRERPFVLALRAAGASTWRILLRHLLPNLSGTLLALLTLQVSAVILAESALSFLNLGVVSPQISWGLILAEGRDQMRFAWWIVAAPGLAITMVTLLVNLLGDALRGSYDPKKQGV